MRNKIILGCKAKEKITGFTGIVIGHVTYLTGCDQYLLIPKSSDGKYPEAVWLDEGKLEKIGKGLNKSDVIGDKNGADIPAPIK